MYSDYFVFVKRATRGCIIFIVYVDDIVLSGSDNEGIQETKDWLHSKLYFKELGSCYIFLGLRYCEMSRIFFPVTESKEIFI